MAVLHTSPIDGGQISWKGNLGAIEISDLGPNFRFQRVYDDSADIGLTVVSPKTGKEIVFCVVRQICDLDDEVHAWELASITGGAIDTYKLVVFND